MQLRTSKTFGKRYLLLATAIHLLAASWGVGADESAPLEEAQPATGLAQSAVETRFNDSLAAGTQRAGILAFVGPAVTWLAWPLAGGVLILAAVNSRKKTARIH